MDRLTQTQHIIEEKSEAWRGPDLPNSLSGGAKLPFQFGVPSSAHLPAAKGI